MAPRAREDGTRGGIERVHALWADVDGPEALAALRNFSPRPSIVISSGSPDSVHAYWSLWPPAAPDKAERANRRLAAHLGADMRATDAARILRPPGTLNFKHDPPTPVTLVHLEVEVFTVEEVVGDLADPADNRTPTRSSPRLGELRGDDPLQHIPPAFYIQALTGQEVGRDGKCRCPLPGHDDRTPSCHAYEDPERGFFCFGCGRGGTVVDLAAELWGLTPRGEGFHEIRRRLTAELLPHIEALAA